MSLMGPGFWVVSLLALVLVTALSGVTRHLVFLGVNLLFLSRLQLGMEGILSTIAFCLLGYLLVRLIVWQPRWGLHASLIIYISLFIYMRNYEFLGWVLPREALSSTLRTIGLSFLLFKVVHVMIEARSKTLGRCGFFTYLSYSLNYLTFMMGPIQRYQDFRQQWYGRREAIPLSLEAHLDAVIRILIG